MKSCWSLLVYMDATINLKRKSLFSCLKFARPYAKPVKEVDTMPANVVLNSTNGATVFIKKFKAANKLEIGKSQAGFIKR